MKTYINKIPAIFMAFLLLGTVGCKKEYNDASGALVDDVLKTSKGLTSVAVGVHRLYVTSRPGLLYNSVTTNGFVTNEVALRNSGNVPELQLSTGGVAVDGTNTILTNMWTNANKIILEADNVINNAALLGDKNYASGLIAYASIFKALALGNMSQYWEKIPSGIGKNVNFITRVEGFTKAISVIDNALSTMQANAPSTSVIANLPAGINITNTLYALKARYALFAGNYDLALSSANLVDLTKKSTFNFDALTLNPIYEIATSTYNVYSPTNISLTNVNLGLTGTFAPDPNDKRIPFYTYVQQITNSDGSITKRVNFSGFAAASATAFPVYLPGEITLIKAEAMVRKTTPDLPNALIELNKVVTKTPSADPFSVGADLPAIAGPLTQAQLLDEIYKQRCIELYLSGLKIVDMRRFGRPDTEMRRKNMPYPFTERDNNTNTPADPAF